MNSAQINFQAIADCSSAMHDAGPQFQAVEDTFLGVAGISASDFGTLDAGGAFAEQISSFTGVTKNELNAAANLLPGIAGALQSIIDTSHQTEQDNVRRLREYSA